MNERRKRLIEHFIAKCSMAIVEARAVADMNCRMYDVMECGEVRFKFKKVDGSIRDARGTMRSDAIPEIKGNGRPVPYDVQLYYDLDKRAFRSFKKENLICFE